MATANDIITRALRLTGSLGVGEALEASEAADGLTALNSMVSSWALEKLMLFKFDTVSYAPTTESFTIGPTGDLVTARPVAILSAYRRNDDLDWPVDVIERVQYESIIQKNLESLLQVIYYKPDYPNGRVFCWPVTNSDTLYLSVQQELSSFPTLTTELNLPPGYQEALTFNLAVLMAPEYSAEASPTVVRRAMNSKRLIKTVNNEVPLMSLDPAMYGNQSYGAPWWVPPQ